MKLYSGKVTTIASDIIDRLAADGDIEVLAEERDEAILDVEAILKMYIQTDHEISEKAREILEMRGLDYAYLGRIKKSLAEEKGFIYGEESMDYIINQIIEMFMHSAHIEEVFSEDKVLRKKMAASIRKNTDLDEDIDKQVKDKIKNLEEGTATWEIEYAKIKDAVVKARKLED
jgi:uncharacterized protein